MSHRLQVYGFENELDCHRQQPGKWRRKRENTNYQSLESSFFPLFELDLTQNILPTDCFPVSQPLTVTLTYLNTYLFNAETTLNSCHLLMFTETH